MDDISVEEFAQLLASKKEIQILDVREFLEFHTYNIGGINIPLGQIQNILEEEELDFNPEEAIIVVCQHGVRSKTAKVLLQNAGFHKTRNLIGGLVKLRRIS